MEYYIGLNEVIDEIEKELTNEIDYKNLAKIIGTSEYTLQRIFCFLTGITLTDYIKKRRLSKAGEDIQITKEKIINIAMKYQYDSSISFARAFRRIHGIAPSEVRKKEISLKMFPKMEFKPIDNDIKELEYRKLDLDEQTFYGVSTKISAMKNKEAIKKLWNKCEKDGTLKYIRDNSITKEKYYGITEYIDLDKANETIKYSILGKIEKKGFDKFKLSKAKWIAFKLNSKEQKDILDLITTIYTKWLPTSNYNIILPYPSLEIYYEEYCEYCIAVK